MVNNINYKFNQKSKQKLVLKLRTYLHEQANSIEIYWKRMVRVSKEFNSLDVYTVSEIHGCIHSI